MAASLKVDLAALIRGELEDFVGGQFAGEFDPEGFEKGDKGFHLFLLRG
jgi:hypothetical protein